VDGEMNVTGMGRRNSSKRRNGSIKAHTYLSRIRAHPGTRTPAVPAIDASYLLWRGQGPAAAGWCRGCVVHGYAVSEKHSAASVAPPAKKGTSKKANQVVTRADAKVKAARSGNHEDFIRDAQEDAVR
jgi:hypothetical protein